MPATPQQIADNARGFQEFGPTTLKAIIAYALYKEAAASGYVVDSSISGIVQNARCVNCTAGLDLLAALAQRAVATANLAGAALPTDVGALVNLVRELEHSETLDGAIVAILLQMKNHVAGP